MVNSLKDKLKGKIVIIGVGNVLKCDDGIGPRVCDRIDGKVMADVINCGVSPENYTSVIRKKEPNTVVIVDAVDLKLSPGKFKILSKDEIKDETFSTHNFSLKVFSEFLETETHANVIILGIQPERITFGSELSEKVKKALDEIERLFLLTIPKGEGVCMR